MNRGTPMTSSDARKRAQEKASTPDDRDTIKRLARELLGAAPDDLALDSLRAIAARAIHSDWLAEHVAARLAGVTAERDALRARIEAVEKLAESWYGVHDGLAGDLRAALAGGDS